MTTKTEWGLDTITDSYGDGPENTAPCPDCDDGAVECHYCTGGDPACVRCKGAETCECETCGGSGVVESKLLRERERDARAQALEENDD